MLIITRRNEFGDYVFSPEDDDITSGQPDVFESAINFMGNNNPSFITNPNDIIAYYSPKRELLYPVSNRLVTGSPLSNFTENVNVISTFHNGITVGGSLTSNAVAEIEIFIDLKKNERINAY
jgi:hypothetical protein